MVGAKGIDGDENDGRVCEPPGTLTISAAGQERDDDEEREKRADGTSEGSAHDNVILRVCEEIGKPRRPVILSREDGEESQLGKLCTSSVMLSRVVGEASPPA